MFFFFFLSFFLYDRGTTRLWRLSCLGRAGYLYVGADGPALAFGTLGGGVKIVKCRVGSIELGERRISGGRG